MVEQMESPHLKSSQNKVFSYLVKIAKEGNISKLSEKSEQKYLFSSSCPISVDQNLQKQLTLLHNLEYTLEGAYNILNRYFYDKRNLQLGIQDGYFNCIEKIDENNWRSFKLVNYTILKKI